MTKQNNVFCITTLLCCVVFLSGCGKGDRKVPKDMPRLFPCTLTITQESVPLADANVMLLSDSKWSAGGKTNEKGEVMLLTNGFYDGVPEGTYKVTVSKVEVIMDEAKENVVKQTDVVENKYQAERTTPLELVIGKGDNNKTFDIGKAVKINVPVD